MISGKKSKGIKGFETKEYTSETYFIFYVISWSRKKGWREDRVVTLDND